MRQGKTSWRGFTLIAALLILVLLSGVGGRPSVHGHERIPHGRQRPGDQPRLLRRRVGHGEAHRRSVAALYAQSRARRNAQIQNLINFPPTPAMVSGMSYNETITYPFDANGNPSSSWNTISSGSNQGLYAEIIPMTMQVIATRPSGASVNMTRKVEVALIPVFQFGVFCGYDCSYFPGAEFRVWRPCAHQRESVSGRRRRSGFQRQNRGLQAGQSWIGWRTGG